MSDVFDTFDLESMERSQVYKLFVTAIVPRPIGWISTVSTGGIRNLAPFSWFNSVCADPPMVIVSIGRRGGRPKDTAENILETGEFVVNVATKTNINQMVHSSTDYPSDVDEFVAARVTPVPSTRVTPPRVAESPIAIECHLDRIITPGNGATDLIMGRCLLMHIDRDVLADDGCVDATKLKPVGRLGRDEYTIIENIIHIPRPNSPKVS